MSFYWRFSILVNPIDGLVNFSIYPDYVIILVKITEKYIAYEYRESGYKSSS